MSNNGRTETIAECGPFKARFWSYVEKGRAARTAGLIQKAFDRVAEANELKRKPAAWWLAMVEATEAFAAKDLVDVPAILEARAGLFRAIWEAEASRQEWLAKNGFGRNGRRGRR